MDGQSYDPLLGLVTQRLEKRSKSASTGAPKSSGDEAETPTSPSAEEVQNARHALNLHNVAAAGWLFWIVRCTMSEDVISPEAFKMYRDILLEDVGSPIDPIEIMLVEQLALAHFAIGRLQIKACIMEDAKLSATFSDAATRLLGEFRRCSLALEDYRAKQAARKERPADNDVAEKTVPAPAARNGKPRPSANGETSPNGKKKPVDTKLTTTGEIPECIRQRMRNGTNGASKRTAATARNGKA